MPPTRQSRQKKNMITENWHRGMKTEPIMKKICNLSELYKIPPRESTKFKLNGFLS